MNEHQYVEALNQRILDFERSKSIANVLVNAGGGGCSWHRIEGKIIKVEFPPPTTDPDFPDVPFAIIKTKISDCCDKKQELIGKEIKVYDFSEGPCIIDRVESELLDAWLWAMEGLVPVELDEDVAFGWSGKTAQESVTGTIELTPPSLGAKENLWVMVAIYPSTLTPTPSAGLVSYTSTTVGDMTLNIFHNDLKEITANPGLDFGTDTAAFVELIAHRYDPPASNPDALQVALIGDSGFNQINSVPPFCLQPTARGDLEYQMAIGTTDVASIYSSAPTGYTTGQELSNTSTSSLGVGAKQVDDLEEPGAFTISSGPGIYIGDAITLAIGWKVPAKCVFTAVNRCCVPADFAGGTANP